MREQGFRGVVEALVMGLGFELYDIELPSATRGYLRVFVARPDAPFTFEDCSQVTRAILDLEKIEEMLPGEVKLEVSSPGVNRKLKSAAHFMGAVGERIRFFSSDPDLASLAGKKAGAALRGILRAVENHQLSLELEETGKLVVLDMSDVSEAKVDHVFD